MKFSIVTPSFNSEKYIRQTLDSVLQQEFEGELQYLVMDGKSKDNTVEILKSYKKKHTKVFDYHSEKDSHPAEAISKGFAKCDGDIIAWINSDDYYEPGVFQKVSEVFAANPEALWVFGYYRMIDEEGNEIRKKQASYKHFLMRHYSYSLLLIENTFAQPSIFFRKELVDKVGELDYKSKHHTAFDYGLWLKMAKLGKPVLTKNILSNFRYHDVSISMSQTKALFKSELNYAKKEFKRHPFAIILHHVFYLRNIILYNIWKL